MSAEGPEYKLYEANEVRDRNINYMRQMSVRAWRSEI
jgi:hypothetical protein